MPIILTINAGSSSVKYQCFEMTDEVCLAKGQIDRLGSPSPNLFYERHDSVTHHIKPTCRQWSMKRFSDSIFATLLDAEKGILQNLNDIAAVGHRVVHGGSRFAESALITLRSRNSDQSMRSSCPHCTTRITWVASAPVIEALPNAAHVAVFDTAFHQTMPDYAYMYALPYSLYERYGIRRYGFHGTSHQYVSTRAAEILGRPLTSLKLITCHLGNGCSITAVDQGQSVDTSMGLTPLEGLMMGTRCATLIPRLSFT